jgi:hypothetical protein
MANENRPPYRISIVGAVVAVIATTGAVIVGVAFSSGMSSDTTPILAGLLAIVGSTVPSILSLVKVEQVSNDIRNGVVTEKARQGAEQAIENKGVVTRGGPVVLAEIDALKALVQTNNEILAHLVQGRKDDGRPGI